MKRNRNVLICVLLIVLSITQPILSKRTFSSSRHSYPKSGGLSGGGGHSYPSSGGLSGGGGHSYPSSGGLSGNSHGYPSSGGSHSYPSSGGSHGYPSSGGLSGSGSGNRYPSSGSAYPSNAGSHSYPASKGVSGNTGSQTTNIHHHYHYNPPQQIRYTPAHGGAPVSYPVYHGTPPTYVYQYKDSGSKYGTLLAGLALLNLGTLAGTAYAVSKSHSNYKPQPGEICKFGVKKDNGDYEETKIDCQLITSFIFQEEAKTTNNSPNVTVVTTTVTNVTTVNSTNGDAPPPASPVLYEMYPNGTLVPHNSTADNTTSTANNTNNPMTSSVITTTTTNTTTVSALDVKGKPVEVTPGMQCYVIRHTPSTNMKKSVPCGLLQTYAEKSLKKNSASKNVPFITLLTVVVALFVSN